MKGIALLAILAALTLACTGNPEPTAPDPDPTLQAEIRALREDVRELQRDMSMDRSILHLQSAKQETQPEPKDICDRPPMIQQALLKAVAIRQCSFVPYPELFRIDQLSVGNHDKPIDTLLKSSDFAGLVNLTELNIQIRDTCGQWDDLTFAESVVAELPSLRKFHLILFRRELDRRTTSAEDLAEAIFLAINNGQEIQTAVYESDSNENYMRTWVYDSYQGGSGRVEVRVETGSDFLPCRHSEPR